MAICDINREKFEYLLPNDSIKKINMDSSADFYCSALTKDLSACHIKLAIQPDLYTKCAFIYQNFIMTCSPLKIKSSVEKKKN